MAACVFCAITRGEAAASRVVETPEVVGFLDVKPLFHGHVLVVPRAHVVTLGDLPLDMIAPLFATVQRVARAVEEAMGAGGSFVALNNRVSQSVPHLHVHVVPRTKGDGLRGFFWPRTRYASDEEREAVAARISAALARSA
jgi:histidine triad (HIT) family protein